MAGKKTSKAPAKKTTAISEKFTKTAILNSIYLKCSEAYTLLI